MAVYKRGYQRYQGPIRGHWARFWILPRFAWERMMSQRLVVMLLVLSMVWPLFCVFYLYIGNHLELLGSTGAALDFFTLTREKVFNFMSVQAWFPIFLAALTGPGCIAPDLANNALPLYFSRPITRLDYTLGRLITLLGLLSIITWIPGIVLFTIQTSMAGRSWFLENWGIAIGMFAGFILWILLVSLVALAGSAYVRMKVIAGGVVLGFFFILSGASGIVNVVFRSEWGNIISPFWATRRLWYAPLAVEPPDGPGILLCVCALAAIMILLVLVLERKLRPVEVIK
jgi:ABC-2 type transport system permease protein